MPGVVVNAYSDPQDALDDIADADAAYGTVPPELLARARKLAVRDKSLHKISARQMT